MSWRTVVISKSAKLDYQMGFMVVRQDITTKIYISEIAMIIVETTAVSLTASLLCELTKKKIRKQAELLRSLRKIEAEMLYGYICEMEIGDVTNREGHAAKVYFNALFGKDFTRTMDISINAALNYGYGIILSVFTREIVANGYITQLGLFHENRFNPFNLASDLMEVYRPMVDLRVYNMKPQQFETEEKRHILGVLEEEVIIGGRSENVNNAIKLYCKSVFDALNEHDPSIIKFYKK